MLALKLQSQNLPDKISRRSCRKTLFLSNDWNKLMASPFAKAFIYLYIKLYAYKTAKTLTIPYLPTIFQSNKALFSISLGFRIYVANYNKLKNSNDTILPLMWNFHISYFIQKLWKVFSFFKQIHSSQFESLFK